MSLILDNTTARRFMIGDVLTHNEVEWLTEHPARDGRLSLADKEFLADLRENAIEVSRRFKEWMTGEVSAA